MAIRQPPSDIKDPNLRGFLQEIRNAIGGVGEQVNKLTRSVASISTGGGSGPGQDTNPGSSDPNSNPGSPSPTGDGLSPPPPSDLTATADVWSIRLQWVNPVIIDYKETEIWAQRVIPAYSSSATYTVNAKVSSGEKVYRSKQSGNSNKALPIAPATQTDWWEETSIVNMPGRVRVDAVAGTSYTFTGLDGGLLTGGETWAFWARTLDTEYLYSTYCPDDAIGVQATTLLDPGAYLDLLTESITESQLYADLGSRINLIDASVDIPNSVNARLADQHDELVQMLSEVAVGGGGFDSGKIWYFDATAEITGWTANAGTLAVTASNLTFTPNSPATAPSFTTVAFDAISGVTYPLVRIRVKRGDPGLIGTPTWSGTLSWWASTNTTSTPTGSLSVTEPDNLATDYTELTWDLHEETGWTANSINKLRFALSGDSDSTSSDANKFSIDWMAVGRNAPGASYAQVEAVRVLSDNKNRTFFQPTIPVSDANYTLKTYDLWFDTADGNKPYRYNPSSLNTTVAVGHKVYNTNWFESTDTRLADSWAEIYDIKNATVSPSGAAAQRINLISSTASTANSTANSALTTANSKATISDVNNAFAGSSGSLATRLSNTETSLAGKNKVFFQSTTPTPQAVGDLWYDTISLTNVILKYCSSMSPVTWTVRRTDTKTYYTTYAARPTTNLLTGDILYDTAANNEPYLWTGSDWVKVIDNYVSTKANAAVVNFEQTKIGYATLNSAPNTPFDGNGTTLIYSATTYPDATYPQYAANRYRIIDSLGVTLWNAAQPSQLASWHPGLPLASAVKQVSVTVGGQTGTIEQSFTAQATNITTAQTTANGAVTTANSANSTANTAQSGVNALNLQYTVKLDNNGYVAGFGLASNDTNATPQSAFGVRADSFWIAPPNAPAYSSGTTYAKGAVVSSGTYTSNNGVVVPILYASLQDANLNHAPASNATWWQRLNNTTGTRLPFVVVTTTQTLNGETVEPGVYIDTATIQKATITEALIGNAAITNAKIGQYIASSDFTTNGGSTSDPVSDPGTAGWCINKNGQAVFNNVRVRGDVLLGGANLIQNSEARHGLNGIYASSANPAEIYAGTGTPVGGSAFVMGGANSLFLDFMDPSGSGNIVCKPNQVYEVSALTGMNGCTQGLQVITFDSSGNATYPTMTGDATNSTAGGGAQLSNFKTIYARFTTPSNATRVLLRFTKTAGASTSFVRITRVNLCEVPAHYAGKTADQIGLIPWSPGGVSLLDTLALRANAVSDANTLNENFSTIIASGSATTQKSSDLPLNIKIAPSCVVFAVMVNAFRIVGGGSTSTAPARISVKVVRVADGVTVASSPGVPMINDGSSTAHTFSFTSKTEPANSSAQYYVEVSAGTVPAGGSGSSAQVTRISFGVMPYYR